MKFRGGQFKFIQGLGLSQTGGEEGQKKQTPCRSTNRARKKEVCNSSASQLCISKLAAAAKSLWAVTVKTTIGEIRRARGRNWRSCQKKKQYCRRQKGEGETGAYYCYQTRLENPSNRRLQSRPFKCHKNHEQCSCNIFWSFVNLLL